MNNAVMKLSKNYYPLVGLLFLLISAAVVSYFYQVTHGLAATGLREPVTWGFYVVFSTFFYGLGAGIMMMLMVGLIKKKIQAESTLLYSLAALVSLILAGAFIIINLGRPDRFYFILLHLQPGSPLMWDLFILMFLLTVTVLLGLGQLRHIYLDSEPEENASFTERFLYRVVTVKREWKIKESLLKKLYFLLLALIAGGYLITTEGFAGMQARPEWHTPLVNLSFLLTAALGSISLLILLESLTGAAWGTVGENSFFRSGKKLLIVLLLADLAVIGIKYFRDDRLTLIRNIITLFPYSMESFILIGNLIPVLLVLSCRKSNNVSERLVPLLILGGALLKRADFIIPAYYRRWLPFSIEAIYWPTLPEILVIAGTFSAGIVALIGAIILVKLVSTTCRAKQ